MQKSVLVLRLQDILFSSRSQFCQSNHKKSLLLFITSSLTVSQNRSCSSYPDPNAKTSALSNYLIRSLKFTEARAFAVSCSRHSVSSLEKPERIVQLFKSVGFSDQQIQSTVHTFPQVLFANVEKSVKPKITLLQELGLSGSPLGAFISKNPHILKYGLDTSLKSCIYLIQKILNNDGRNRSAEDVNENVLRILASNYRIVQGKSRFESNILYLESCGVPASHLSALLKKSWMLTTRKEKLEGLVLKALDMGFTRDSKMLVHAIVSLNSINIKKLDAKFETLRMLGFSKDELALMFRKAPLVFAFSNAKLRWKTEFYINRLMIDQSVLIQYPILLSFSIEERVIPRSRVLDILRSKKLMKKDTSVVRSILVSEKVFMKRHIIPFKNDTEELLLAYKGKLLNT